MTARNGFDSRLRTDLRKALRSRTHLEHNRDRSLCKLDETQDQQRCDR